jgi:hypothetical protein
MVNDALLIWGDGILNGQRHLVGQLVGALQ